MAREENMEENGQGSLMQNPTKKISSISLKLKKQDYTTTYYSKPALKMLSSNLHLLTADILAKQMVVRTKL